MPNCTFILTDKDIQLLPEGEEELHYAHVTCTCLPRLTKTIIDERIVYLHNSFDRREIFDILYKTPFHNVLQKKDC